MKKRKRICQAPDCTGCAYSHFSALFHSGPHRECYVRFLVRCLPWNVIGRLMARTLRALSHARTGKPYKGLYGKEVIP